MARKIIHKLIVFKAGEDTYVPVILAGRKNKNGLVKQWILPKLTKSFVISYTKEHIEQIVKLYKKHKDNILYLYKGKWINGKTFSKLLYNATKRAVLIEELNASEFPSFILVNNNEREKDAVVQKGVIYNSDILLSFLNEYNRLVENYSTGTERILPLFKFPSIHFDIPSNKMRKKNMQRNQLETISEGKIALNIKEGSTVNGYIKCIGNKRLEITADIYQAKMFANEAEANEWVEIHNLWKYFGVKCRPEKIIRKTS